MVPPPAAPLSFLAAAAFRLVACGVALIWARGVAMADPTADPVVAAAHFGMVATLSMGVLGALHQFTPVVTQRPLRSTRLAWATFMTWLGVPGCCRPGLPHSRYGWWRRAGGLAAVAVTLLRHRKGSLHLVFVATAAGLLVAGTGLALAATLEMSRTTMRAWRSPPRPWRPSPAGCWRPSPGTRIRSCRSSCGRCYAAAASPPTRQAARRGFADLYDHRLAAAT